MMWIGPVGTFTPLHFDLTNNLHRSRSVGAKKLPLAPPSETRYSPTNAMCSARSTTIDGRCGGGAYPRAAMRSLMMSI